MPLPDSLPIMISQRSFDSDEPYDLVQSNISVINAMFQDHFRPDEVSEDGLTSYYVDYYLAQLNNGGFSQFVFNSRWAPKVQQLVRRGLEAMGAERHLALFEENAQLVEDFDDAQFQRFLASEYFGENPDRDALSVHDDRFFDLQDDEDLIELNAAWIRSRPDLEVLTVDKMEARIAELANQIPDMDARMRAARANEPRYTKLIRKLCAEAGHELDRVTAGDPSFEYEGEQMVAWHFLTDQGHFYLVDLGDRALMRDGETDDQIAEVDGAVD